MTEPIRFKWVKPAARRADVRLGLLQDGQVWAGASWPTAERRAVEAWQAASDEQGHPGTAVWPHVGAPVLLLGMGKKKEFHAARWLRSWAAAGRALAKAGPSIRRASFEWPEGLSLPLEPAPLAGLAAEGLAQGLYAFDAYKSSATARTLCMEWVGDAWAAKTVREAVRRAEVVSNTLVAMRNLANQPANDLGPMEFAAAARSCARESRLSCRIWDMAALDKARCGALLAVAKGSRKPGCLIRLAHAGNRSLRLPPLVVVGKAVTFDTGGISLKPGKGMEWMKFDKCGGMAALATVVLASRLRLPRPVVAYIPAVENMPGSAASRPGDIVTARNGKTIEILNTDAEGRLILADALSFAAEEKPAAIVDVATLTGAALVALGHEASALMANDDRLAMDLILSGETVGERLWQLPLWTEYDRMLRGLFADLQNMGDGTAGTIVGGAFLKQFVPEGIPWAHLDIAGTAWTEKEQATSAPGATLVPARLLLDWVERSVGG